MTKHDEVRQILHDTGFKFTDDRTALDMTDAQVEEFLINFLSIMGDFARKVNESMRVTMVQFASAVEPIRADMAVLLANQEKRRTSL